MSEDAPKPPARIVYCRCAYAQVVPQGVKNAVLEHLCASPASFEAVSDLCEFAAHRDSRLQEIATMAEAGGVKIVACFPRVVKGLFKQAGCELPAEGVEILNMRSQTAEEITSSLEMGGESGA